MSSPGDSQKIYTMWSIFPKIMMMPSSGWERTLENGPQPEIAVLRFLLPMCLLAAGSEFFTLLYHSQLSFTDLLVNSVITFCSFFLGYYIAILFAQLFMPKDARTFPQTDYGRLLTMTGIVSLAFFHILFMALPMFDFVFEFLPLWTVFIIYKGMRIMVVSKERQTLALGVMCIVIICSPLVIDWFFALFR